MTHASQRTLDPADAFALARRQLELDRERTRRFPALFAHKQARMARSPHAFFRGSAQLFYELLRAHGRAGLPRESGLIVGDMHLENVGAYRADGRGRSVVFDLNDFDDAAHGPRALDLLRLCVSTLLAGRTFGANASASLSLVASGLEEYERTRGGKRARARATPGVIRDLIERVSQRTQRELLDARAPMVRGKRSFVRGERYLDLPSAIAARAGKLLEAFVRALGKRAPRRVASYRVLDAAQRVAGTGSLGALRIALLLADDGDGARIIELKEAYPSAVHPWPWDESGGRRARGKDEALTPSDRVVRAARQLVAKPARRLVALPSVLLSGAPVSLVGRALSPQEDKLDLEKLRAVDEQQALVCSVFRLLAGAHDRASEDHGWATFSAREKNALIDRTVVLAGQFEGIALAYARLVGSE